MTPGGWIIMTVSVGSVVALFGWCVAKVVRTPGEEKKLHGVDSHLSE